MLKFPKFERFGLGQKTENLILEVLEKFYLANTASGQNRAELLLEIDTKLKIIQTLVRAIAELKIIDQKKYLLLSEKLVEIGKMLGGWLKASRSSSS